LSVNVYRAAEAPKEPF